MRQPRLQIIIGSTRPGRALRPDEPGTEDLGPAAEAGVG